jgi:hypothetical protein
MTTTEALETYINGNTKDAKKALSRTGAIRIINILRYGFGYSNEKAIATAAFLKGEGTFQAACDAE